MAPRPCRSDSFRAGSMTGNSERFATRYMRLLCRVHRRRPSNFTTPKPQLACGLRSAVITSIFRVMDYK